MAQENSYRQRSYVTGRISLYLQSRQELFGDEPLEEKIVTTKARIEQLNQELAAVEIEDKQASILNAIGAQMSTWGKQLNLEYSNAPLTENAMNQVEQLFTQLDGGSIQ